MFKDISYQNYKKSIDIHGTVLYPAIMVAPVQKIILNEILEKNNKCVKILLVVGPEGGFDPLEEEYLLENGFKSVSLGENVLRAETAPVVALSMINYEFMR